MTLFEILTLRLGCQPSNYLSVDKFLEMGRPIVFNFTYPIFDVEYRPQLERKILLHYLFDEIGAETFDRFKIFLMSKMNEIMPYYNQLYTAVIPNDVNIFDNVNTIQIDNTLARHREHLDNNRDIQYTSDVKNQRDIDFNSENIDNYTDNRDINTNIDNTRNINQTVDMTSNEKTTRNTVTHEQHDHTEKNKYSNTPMSNSNLLTTDSDFYLTEYRWVNNLTEIDTNVDENTNTDFQSNQNTQTTDTFHENLTTTDDLSHKQTVDFTSLEKLNALQNTTDHTFDDFIEHKFFKNNTDYVSKYVGKNNSLSYPQVLTEWRETFINIDVMIISELSTLFMKIF